VAAGLTNLQVDVAIDIQAGGYGMAPIPLAWYNLRHQRSRLLVAVAGVSFAVLLIFMNLGFSGALVNTTTNFYDRFNADIFLLSPSPWKSAPLKPFPGAPIPGRRDCRRETGHAPLRRLRPLEKP
jgi:hypothetical protein